VPAEFTPRDDELLHALGRLGADYEPDLAAIRRRVDTPRRAVLRSDRPLTHAALSSDRAHRAALRSDLPRTTARRPRRPRTVLLAAAAVAVICSTVAVAARFTAVPSTAPGAVAGSPADGSPSVATAAVATVAVAAPQTPTAPPTLEPTASASGTPGPGAEVPAQTGSPTATPKPDQATPQSTVTGSPAAPPTTSGTPIGQPGGVVTTSASSGPQVDVVLPTSTQALAVNLAAPELLDWLAVGTRSDGVLVRAKRAAAAPVLTLERVPGATVTPSPFRVSWTGGLPEQDRKGASTWSTVPAGSGWTIDVAPSAQPLRVVIYTGSADLAASLTVSGGASATAEPIQLGSTGSSPTAAIVTLRLAPSAEASRIMLGGTASGSAPRAFLSAVTVSATS